MSEQIVEARALNGLRLLAVEDQPDMLDYLRRLLEEQGAEVVTAGSATDALALLDHRGHARFDLMLTDIGMPGMDGYGLIRTVREKPRTGCNRAAGRGGDRAGPRRRPQSRAGVRVSRASRKAV